MRHQLVLKIQSRGKGRICGGVFDTMVGGACCLAICLWRPTVLIFFQALRWGLCRSLAEVSQGAVCNTSLSGLCGYLECQLSWQRHLQHELLWLGCARPVVLCAEIASF